MVERRGWKRPWLGLPGLIAVAVVAVVAAIAYARAPVVQDALVYTYRPVADGAEGLAAAPLGMARPAADALHVEIPCDKAGSTFATSPTPEWFERRGSLFFTDPGNALFVYVRDDVVEAVVNGRPILSVTREESAACLGVIDFRDGQWTMAVGSVEQQVDAPGPRVWEGSFTGPAASDARSTVTVETRELGTSPGGAQWVLAVVAIMSLLVVSHEIVVRTSVTGSERVRVGGLSSVDALVVLMLIVWWILIPANIDDGWIVARVAGYPVHGDIAGPFTVGAAPMPFGYWHEWLQHLWIGLSTTVLVTRVPALVLGGVTWWLLRWIGAALGVRRGSVGLVVMGAAFIVAYGAWGMTLRPEPMVALLVTVSLSFALRFRRGARGWILAVWPVVIALAVAAHPAGILTAAPVLASWRNILMWVRRGRERVVVGLAWMAVLGSTTILLWLVDSNLASTQESIDAYRANAHGKGIADELFRYRLFDEAPYATPLRRLTVGLIVVGLGVWLIRRRERSEAASLPAWTLVSGLVLLSLTPSKWPWHVGSLMAIAAVVLAVEVGRIERPRWAFGVLGIAVMASWTWSVSLPWNAFDLRTYEWTEFDPLSERALSTTGFLPFELTSLVGWVLIGAVVGGLAAAVHHLRPAKFTPTPPEAMTVLTMVLAVSMTAATLWSDASDTNGWTFGGQNFASLRGEPTCGLADEILVPAPGSAVALTRRGLSTPEADGAAGSAGFGSRGVFEIDGYLHTDQNSLLPVADAVAVGSWTVAAPPLGEANTGKYRSDWFAVEPEHRAVVVFVLGSYGGGIDSDLGNGFGLQWGFEGAEGVEDRGVEVPRLSGYFVDWTMLLFERPDGADRVRILLRDDVAGTKEGWVASTLPFGVEMTPISAVVARAQPTILVSPPLGPYLPCVQSPRFERSIVPIPGLIVQTWAYMWEDTFTGSVSDRWFRIPVNLEPPLRSSQVGAHTGDARNFVFISQDYLTGRPARLTGVFAPVG